MAKPQHISSQQLPLTNPAPIAPGAGLIRSTGPEWRAYGLSRRWKDQQVDELYEIVRERHPTGRIDAHPATIEKLVRAKPPLALVDVHAHPAVPTGELWVRKETN